MRAQSVVLDDFATMRTMGFAPPCTEAAQATGSSNCLWPGMSNQGPTTCTTVNNELVCKTKGTAPDGLGFWIMTLVGQSTVDYSNPGSYIKSWIKSGTWNANINRMRFRYKCTVPIAANTGGGYWLTIGTYVRSPQEPNPPESGQGRHFYHFLNQPSAANEWVDVELNRMVQFRKGWPGDAKYPEDPEWNEPTMTYPAHYFDGMTHFYFGPTYGPELRPANVTCSFAPFTLHTVANGADAFVSSITGAYSPSRGRYDLSWNQPKNIPGGVRFEVRYSTSSLRTNGWSTGTDGGQVVGQDGSPYTEVNYSSPAVARAPTMFFGIRPRMAIASLSRTNPAQITLTDEGFLNDGDQIRIADAAQSTGAAHPMNGLYTIRNVNRKTMILEGVDGTAWPALRAGSGTATATSETRNFAEFVVGTGVATPPPAPSPCDLNGDQIVNSSDVQVAVNAALGTASCTGDLNGDGKCNVVDVQRVANAVSSGTCRTGQ